MKTNYLDDFQKYVSYVEVDFIEYLDEPREHENPESHALLELQKGGLYVTWGDEKPWLQVQVKPGYSFALNPELVFYWLDEIKKFYDKYDSSEQSITEEEQ